ncbi:hypothetical protein WOLCODRAFT_97142 [Wolfiporia cocos MD-104 SS10]|uniref:Uncharacterized protein n=1 Tax=Wolfiporia cocos (strain MD-104) TaxID=742152 RepID=A0A2H3JA15_WOLCO|nr:hypothetical protein WOLCODRAFT_97142 [Wolfiporia cocos MD-104 SS10]
MASRSATQTFKLYARSCLRPRCLDLPRRTVATASSLPPSAAALPWFVDPSEAGPSRSTPPHLRPSPTEPLPPLPAAIAPESPIAALHAALAASPHLEPGTLRVREPIPTAVGPPLPETEPKGRRKRGRTYSGEGVGDYTGGIWSWLVVAQVKEGTEKRGAIESVVRVVRRTLLTTTPPLPLPPNSKKRVNDDWAMIDAGEFAVHIVSRDARERYFPDRRDW